MKHDAAILKKLGLVGIRKCQIFIRQREVRQDITTTIIAIDMQHFETIKSRKENTK